MKNEVQDDDKPSARLVVQRNPMYAGVEVPGKATAATSPQKISTDDVSPDIELSQQRIDMPIIEKGGENSSEAASEQAGILNEFVEIQTRDDQGSHEVDVEVRNTAPNIQNQDL